MITPRSRRIRRTSALLASVAATALLLVGCSASASPSPTPSSTVDPAAKKLVPADIAKSGTLSVAMDVSFPPFEFFESDGTTITGIDYQLAQGVASDLGLKLKAVNTPFDGIIPGLAANRFDVIFSGLTDTPARQAQVTFVDYFKGGNGFLVAKGNPHDLKDFDSLCGQQVATITGTTPVEDLSTASTKCVSEGKKAIDVSLFPQQDNANLALKTGRVVAVLMDSAAGGYMAKQSDGAFQMLPPYAASYFGAGVPKGSELAKAIQTALRSMKKSGEYQKILKQYGVSTGVVDDFLINGTQK